MENYEQKFAEELAHYDEILALIHAQLSAAQHDNSKSMKDLQNMNRDMWENASHSTDDFDGAVELSQFYGPLGSSVFAVESSAEKVRLLKLLIGSAYFARIDFCIENKEEYEKIYPTGHPDNTCPSDGRTSCDKVYIGRGNLMDDVCKKIRIYDWRSPIASLFYRFETGDASYDAPDGRIAGHIERKRQYEIKKGIFEYFFDADVQIEDEFLRKMLSGNTSSKMKTIVETIQKDQDIAIRDMTHDLLMVQGIAGSGKTSIALHRVAYLKYQGLANRLDASDIIILSPNTLFEQYISNVLPELGEDEVKSIIFDDMIQNLLPERIRFQSHSEQLEMLISCTSPTDKAIQKQSMEFKMSDTFVEILNRYVQTLPASHIEFSDVEYDGRTVFTSQCLRNRVLQMNGVLGLSVKLDHLRHDIFEEIHELRKVRMPKLLKIARDDIEHPFDWEEYARLLSIEESTRLFRVVDHFTKLDSISLYKKLIFEEGLLMSLADGLVLPENIGAILLYSQSLLKGDIMGNEDALAVSFLQLLVGGHDIYKHIRQVVVDEAQDYYNIHFAMLKRLFPNARYTVLGDINQTIEKRENMTLYEHITNILQPKKACLMDMNKSFRCTSEILSFSMQFLHSDTPFESFNRSGDLPKVVEASNHELLGLKLLEEARLSEKSGYQSIGIICKTAQEANTLFLRLKDSINLHLVGTGDHLDTTGVFVIPITMSKGLEFDSVLVYGVDEEHYHTEDDKKLLYIASTRALHRLNMFYTGEKSSLFQGGSI